MRKKREPDSTVGVKRVAEWNRTEKKRKGKKRKEKKRERGETTMYREYKTGVRVSERKIERVREILSLPPFHNIASFHPP